MTNPLLYEILDALNDLRAEQVALRQLLEGQQQKTAALSRADRAALGRLLPAAGGIFGSEPFLTRDLFESDAPAAKLVTHGLNVRQVGRLFRRSEGQPIDGYLVRRDGAELNAILWRILKA